MRARRDEPSFVFVPVDQSDALRIPASASMPAGWSLDHCQLITRRLPPDYAPVECLRVPRWILGDAGQTDEDQDEPA